MTIAPPLARIAVGVLVERRKGSSPWADTSWAPVAVLAGVPDTPAWTALQEVAAMAALKQLALGWL